MHTAVFVIGPDPVGRVRAAALPLGTPDWVAIGGRYTGSLILRPGATTGVVYGDAIPDAEAWLARVIGEGFQRGVNPQPRGQGVDQAQAGDIIGATSPPPYILDADGVIHHPGLTGEEMAAAVVLNWAARQPGIHSDISEETAAAVQRKAGAWAERSARMLAALPADALVTVVNVHL